MKKIILLFLLISLSFFSYAQTFVGDIAEENKDLISECLKNFKDTYKVSLDFEVAQRGNSLWFYSGESKSFLFREEIKFLSSDTNIVSKQYSLYKNFFKAIRGGVVQQDSLREDWVQGFFVFVFEGVSVTYRDEFNFIRRFNSIEDAASELCASEMLNKEAPESKNVILLKNMIESSRGLLSVEEIIKCHSSSDFYRFISLCVGKPKRYLKPEDVYKVINYFEQ